MTRQPAPGRGFAAKRSVLIRDFIVFALKLAIDGLKDVVLVQIASIAVLADLLRGENKPRLFYRVVQASEKFDLWLNLNGAVNELERGQTEDGLFGASRAGSDTLLGKRWVGSDSIPQPRIENFEFHAVVAQPFFERFLTTIATNGDAAISEFLRVQLCRKCLRERFT